MKKMLVLTAVINVALVFGMVLAGCDDTGGGYDSGGSGSGSGSGSDGSGTGSGGGTGTIRIVNNAQYNWDMIVMVAIGDVTSESRPVLDVAGISPGGGSKTYTGLTAGHSYVVAVSDTDDTQYNSSAFTLNAGATKTVTYDGYKLTVQ